MTEWFEDEDFWRDIRDYIFNPSRIQSAQHEAGEIATLLNIEPPAKVLDLACGIGRLTLEFAKRGFHIVGVDRSATYIKQAQDAAPSDQLNVKFMHADIRDIRYTNAFDIVLNTFSSFGYFQDPSDDARVLFNAYAALKKGGRVLLELVGKETIIRNFTRRDWQEAPDGSLLLEDRVVENGWHSLIHRWIYINQATRRDYSLRVRLYSAVEITRLLESNGFVNVAIFGTYSRSPYDHNSYRMIVVAEKP